jgi:type VI secretion system secreted protein VgrG
MAISQTHRDIAIGTPLGEDALLLSAYTGYEELGRPFEYHATLLAERHDVSFDSVVGQNVTIRVETVTGETRYINGYVSRLTLTGARHRLVLYEATIVPWTHFLMQTSDCRIFQEKKVPDIVKEVCRDYGFSDIEDRLTETYRTWEYCVQYRETAFNFISRLMEQEGIYYYFKHENAKHTLVLADGQSSHDPVGSEAIPFETSGVDAEAEAVSGWQLTAQVMPGVVVQNDYDFTAPKKDLIAKAQIQRGHGGASFEIYDYPGEYAETAEGEKLSKVRIEEMHARQERVKGKANVRGLRTGSTFKLSGHPRQDQDREYLVTSCSSSGVTEESESGQAGGGLVYSVGFEALEVKRTFRAARTTPKPIVQGPQTAFVVGPSGEEIWTDKYGRVKVQFHWDRRSKTDETSSCWIRTTQAWAGKKWGAMFIPRIGTEVVVNFLEGDPDRPILGGCVYNGESMPPHPLPDKLTVSVWKTNSSKGGGGANEIRLDDKKGEEMVYLHAQKDRDDRVEERWRQWVGKSLHRIVTEDEKIKVDGDRHDKVAGDVNFKVDGNLSRDVGQKIQEKSGSNYAMDAAQEIHLKAGMKVIIEGGTQVSLKVGGNFVDIGPSGVSIVGTLVNINSGGSAGSGSGSSPTSPTDPEEVPTEEAGETATAPAARPPTPATWGAQAQVMKKAARSGAGFCEECERARLKQKRAAGGGKAASSQGEAAKSADSEAKAATADQGAKSAKGGKSASSEGEAKKSASSQGEAAKSQSSKGEAAMADQGVKGAKGAKGAKSTSTEGEAAKGVKG